VANPLRRPSGHVGRIPLRSNAAKAVRRSASPPRSLDSLVHHRLRLGVLSALAGTDSMTFNELKALLKTTDGNLSVHARKLEVAGFVACAKRFENRKPVTRYRLAAEGRRALQHYIDHIEALVRVTRQSLER
jgi:DNA-binding transcriptional ArsR family regulator